MESEWGWSLAQRSRSWFIRCAVWNATQSSWNVTYTFSLKYSLGRRARSPDPSQLRCRSTAWSARYIQWGTQPASASVHTILRSGTRSKTPPKIMVPITSWHPRMMPRKAFILGPRNSFAASEPPPVRMWKDTGRPSSTEARHSGSHRGSS